MPFCSAGSMGMVSRSVLMKSFLTLFAKDKSGVSAVEYALFAAMLALGIIVSTTKIGVFMNIPFSVIINSIKT
jgi:Flp pilus assembly pilin Flp